MEQPGAGVQGLGETAWHRCARLAVKPLGAGVQGLL